MWRGAGSLTVPRVGAREAVRHEPEATRLFEARSSKLAASLSPICPRTMTAYSTSLNAAFNPAISAPRSLPSVPLFLYGLLDWSV